MRTSGTPQQKPSAALHARPSRCFHSMLGGRGAPKVFRSAPLVWGLQRVTAASVQMTVSLVLSCAVLQPANSCLQEQGVNRCRCVCGHVCACPLSHTNCWDMAPLRTPVHARARTVIPPFHNAVDAACSYLSEDGFMGVADFYVSGKYDLPMRQMPWLRRFFWRCAGWRLGFYEEVPPGQWSHRSRGVCAHVQGCSHMHGVNAGSVGSTCAPLVLEMPAAPSAVHTLLTWLVQCACGSLRAGPPLILTTLTSALSAAPTWSTG